LDDAQCPGGRRRQTVSAPRASLIISSWNGRHLLETCLPRALLAAERADGDHEVIVVDDASTDDSVEYVRREFPQVRLLALERNLRFAGANNAAARFAAGDIFVFLNNDILVAADFLPPLLRHFADPDVFAVTAHIQMTPRRLRAGVVRETGLVRARFEHGFFVLRHEDPESDRPAPVIYAGGGSSAWRRDRFLQLGGFDRLFRPFYFEDLDLSYRGLKAGWRILFEPTSRVVHQHRQTNAPRNFRADYIELMFCKNNLLFMWKALTAPSLLTAHFLALWGAVIRPRSDSHLTACALRACAQLPELLVKKHRTRRKLALTDREVLRRAAPRSVGERPAAQTPDLEPAAPPPLRSRVFGVLADLAAAALILRRPTALWGLDPREPPHVTLVIRAGPGSVVQEAVAQIRARYPAAEVTVLAPESLATETAQQTGEAVISAPSATVVSYQVSRSIITDLRRKRFDTIVVAGDGSRRAELLALLAGPARRVVARDDGAARVFRFAPYQPVILVMSSVWAVVERASVTACLVLAWASLQFEGLLWLLCRLTSLKGTRATSASDTRHR